MRWRSRDGLNLYACEYQPAFASASATPVLCLPGLTRNSRDFDVLAPWLAGLGRRVLALDLRGRGNSDRDLDRRHYQIPVYADDVAGLLDHLSIPRAILLGTSLGGLVTMTFAVRHPKRIAGAVLNDIGPSIDPAGAARIRSYAGKVPPVTDWNSAAAYTKLINGAALPYYTDNDWDAMARRLFREDARGRPVLDYDPQVMVPLGPVRMRIAQWLAWISFRRLTRGRSVLLLRGALSDILAPATVERMRRAAPSLQYAEIPGVGHAPMLSEPEALEALRGFFEEVS